MRFTWDENKEAKIVAERGFDFSFVSLAFSDTHAIPGPSRVVKGEERHTLIGDVGGFVLFVVYTWRELENNEKVCRIITARKAHRKERKRYQSVR